ncbi:extracellular matrix protein 3-like [Amphiura filiformis]|uniref:extracellular matrix protein 3-like n=1 Tax=Amphiura filiformis TaxID=82378 RepID=UPI003B2234CD
MKPSEWFVGCILVGLFVFNISLTDAQCDTPSYNIGTVGIGAGAANPDPTMANRGVPFFPECEPDRQKCFRVQSDSEAAIFLSPTASIGTKYYTIKLDDGGRIQLYKDDDGSGTTVADHPAVYTIISTDFTELCVRATTDNTINLYTRNDAGVVSGPVLSWQDGAGLHDINYILVQNYNGDSSNVAQWQFCDGAVTLLTQNKNNMASSLATTSSGSTDGSTTDNIIDAALNDAVYNINDCFFADAGGVGDDVYWRVDLGDMYDIKAVLVLNEIDGDEPDLENTEIRIGSCSTTITDNAQCGLAYSAAEATGNDNYWVGRECDTNYYGQYVYAYKPAPDPNTEVEFSICELEVWGQVIPDANKPKVGFTETAISELEGDGPTDTKYSVTVQLTDGSADHGTCLEFNIVRVPDDALGPSAPSDRACPAPNFDFNDATGVGNLVHDGILFSPPYPTNDPASKMKSFVDNVCYFYDKAEEDDESFGYMIVPVTPGLLAGDNTGTVTYEEITFTILNDDVTYCWEDITLSVLEGTAVLTAVLTRTGYTDAPSTAVVDTADGTATGNVDYTPLVDFNVDFIGGELSKNVEVEIIDDDCIEGLKMFTIVIDAMDSDGCICRDAAGNNEVDTVTASILNDDAIFRFQDNNPPNNLNPRVYTITETELTKEIVVEREGYLDNDVMIGVQTQPWIDDPSIAASSDDYTQLDRVLMIPAGSSTASVTVTVVDDNEVEPQNGASIAEIFRLVLSKVPSTLDDCVLDTQDMVKIEIIDNDCCWSMMNDALEVNEDGGPAIATVLCERPSCATDCVEMSRTFTTSYSVGSTGITDGTAAGSADFNSRQASVTLPAVTGTATQTSNTISVDILNDIIKEDEEKFEITLTDSSDGEIKEPKTTTVTIVNDDVLVTLNCEVTNEVQENAGKLTVTLERCGDLTASDSVVLFTNPATASDGKDYDGVNVVKTFAAMETTITHEIPIIDDTEYETDEEFFVRIRPYLGQTMVDPVNNMCMWTIKDDDCAFSISATEANSRVTEGVCHMCQFPSHELDL